MKNYELLMIMNPEMSEDERIESLDAIKEVFKEHEVSITTEDVWGDKKMAYKINKSDRGFYIRYELDMDGKAIKAISKEMNLDKNIWRYMFSKED